MRKLLAVCLVTLSLGGCAKLQELTDKFQNIADFATVSNPVTPAKLKQVESGALLVFKGMNLWRKSCEQRLINESCIKQINAVQVYTRQISPYLDQVRQFVKNNDQVNAVVVYNELVGLIKTVKAQVAANGIKV
jgi:predicted nucleic acid-binding Zn ribbon protein